MSTPPHIPSDQNAYFTDPENAAEMARLTRQARMLTQAMGGPLAEQTSLEQVHDVLDIACGPGEWVLEMARRYPNKRVTGIDVSHLMIEYARFQAQQQQQDNASFKEVNILDGLDFPDASFDLVNARLLASFLFRTINAWPDLVQEYVRVTRPGGIIRLTECEWPISANQAMERYSALSLKAIQITGNIFSPDGRQTSVTPMLGSFLRRAGCQDVQVHAYAVDCSNGSAFHQSFYEDMRTFMKLLQPMMVQTGLITQEEADKLYQKALEEVQSDNFNCLWFYLTAWGRRP
ncbi:hypothetical protein KSF_037390 [Reticulibacter mediterranei]|uniref:Methyltransferase domain-containing protein n=1 Tax=Reticulibacter mediterranei TaxID=2778369 RepID=A0A8J3INN4_9CHLR|nr:class I SAM-dependent methyltransferase [Reticulibacter mediterranei]GHO93691.1 hypothetical protein KSF_037390 [Reticulibacter mediterranei]